MLVSTNADQPSPGSRWSLKHFRATIRSYLVALSEIQLALREMYTTLFEEDSTTVHPLDCRIASDTLTELHTLLGVHQPSTPRISPSDRSARPALPALIYLTDCPRSGAPLDQSVQRLPSHMPETIPASSTRAQKYLRWISNHPQAYPRYSPPSALSRKRSQSHWSKS